MRSLAWLAIAPLLLACGADTGPADDGTDAPEIVRRPGATGGDGTPAAAPSTPGAPAGPGASPATACTAQPKCDGAAGPQLGALRPFTHTIISNAILATGPAFHRGRDQIVSVGDAQWAIGKITYSYVDTDLGDEEVDVFVERGCNGAWEKLGTTRTTRKGDHAPVEGVDDPGGRVFFQIPKAKELAAGRHRIRLVVAGDHTSTDLVIDVLPKGSPIVVSDVDGTLTASENAEYPALLYGTLPDAQLRAAEALSALAAKGYHLVYLTARPEWLTGRTHEFLAQSGFPRGIVHTTPGLTGALGGAASTFKAGELALLASHGHQISWAFGNRASDTDAYEAAKINPKDHRVFFRVNDPNGGRRIEAYSEIIPVIKALPATCTPAK